MRIMGLMNCPELVRNTLPLSTDVSKFLSVTGKLDNLVHTCNNAFLQVQCAHYVFIVSEMLDVCYVPCSVTALYDNIFLHV